MSVLDVMIRLDQITKDLKAVRRSLVYSFWLMTAGAAINIMNLTLFYLDIRNTPSFVVIRLGLLITGMIVTAGGWFLVNTIIDKYTSPIEPLEK